MSKLQNSFMIGRERLRLLLLVGELVVEERNDEDIGALARGVARGKGEVHVVGFDPWG